jgi:hypothetical protein
VLLLDGHSSHYTIELLEYARDHNITILAYPPHCTHALQGLDVVCFAKAKKDFYEEIRRFEETHHASVTKGDFAGVWGRAFLRSFTPATVKAAFKATGIHPFNPDVITEKQLKPSLPTSIKGSFPLPQPSPVHAVIAAMAAHPPTAFELSPTTLSITAAGPSSVHVPPSPLSPTISAQRRSFSRNIDPALETPSKRMQLMYGALGSTSSGSILVSKTRITSAYKVTAPVIEMLPELPAPNWTILQNQPPSGYQSRGALEDQNWALTESLECAQEIIQANELIEQNRAAMLVVQHAHLIKLNQALQAKEKKKTDRTKLFADGLGRHLTDAAFIEALKKHEQDKKDEEAGRRERVAE